MRPLFLSWQSLRDVPSFCSITPIPSQRYAGFWPRPIGNLAVQFGSHRFLQVALLLPLASSLRSSVVRRSAISSSSRLLSSRVVRSSAVFPSPLFSRPTSRLKEPYRIHHDLHLRPEFTLPLYPMSYIAGLIHQENIGPSGSTTPFTILAIDIRPFDTRFGSKRGRSQNVTNPTVAI